LPDFRERPDRTLPDVRDKRAVPVPPIGARCLAVGVELCEPNPSEAADTVRSVQSGWCELRREPVASIDVRRPGSGVAVVALPAAGLALPRFPWAGDCDRSGDANSPELCAFFVRWLKLSCPLIAFDCVLSISEWRPTSIFLSSYRISGQLLSSTSALRWVLLSTAPPPLTDPTQVAAVWRRILICLNSRMVLHYSVGAEFLVRDEMSRMRLPAHWPAPAAAGRFRVQKCDVETARRGTTSRLSLFAAFTAEMR